MQDMSMDQVVSALELEKHPEGGFFKRTYCCDTKMDGGRGTASAIYYLIPTGIQSRWHTTDGDEIWFWHAGSPLELMIAPDKATPQTSTIVGSNLINGEKPQVLVPANHWQSAKCAGTSTDDWTLVSCMVSPEFQFEGFVMADEDWEPQKA